MFQIKNKRVDKVSPLYYNKEKRKENKKMTIEEILEVLTENDEEATVEDYGDFFLIEVNTNED